MRLWEGIEREGIKFGVKTLFVESNRLTCDDLYLIQAKAKERGISRLYLGAGKVDVQTIHSFWVEILKGYEVVVETTPQNLHCLYHVEHFDSVVLRNDIGVSNYQNITPKIDNGKSVTLFYNGITNTLEAVKDGAYSDTDKIIEI